MCVLLPPFIRVTHTSAFEYWKFACMSAQGASTLPLPPGTTASGLIYVRSFEGLRVIVTFSKDLYGKC